MKEKAKENKQEPFEDDEMAKKFAAQQADLARAYHMQKQAAAQAKAAQEAQAANEKAAQERTAQRAKNKAMQQKWDSTRNNEFGKFNEYLQSLYASGGDVLTKVREVRRLTDEYLAPPGGSFSNSTPNQLKTLNDKMKQFYEFNKVRDNTILDITNRMTKVNNILGQASSGQTLTG